MKLELPPVLFYGLGAILIIFGTLRFHHLGWQRRKRPKGDADSDGVEEGDAPRTSPTARRHMTFGLLWVAMGIFLVASTYYNSRR